LPSQGLRNEFQQKAKNHVLSACTGQRSNSLVMRLIKGEPLQEDRLDATTFKRKPFQRPASSEISLSQDELVLLRSFFDLLVCWDEELKRDN
jgi:hypothetical protein